MQQDHPEGHLPLVGRHAIQRVELETGEALPTSVNQKVLEGSYSTKLTVRCDGQTVRVAGNPSRWQRVDNLIGLASLDDAVAVYNGVLSQLGLPPFTKNTRLMHRQSPDGKRSQIVGDGAEITQIDWTVNHQVGKGREASFIRGMSSMQIGRGRKPKLYPNGMTCNWGEASTWVMTKLYCKAFELNEHLKKDRRKKGGVTAAQLDYIEQLIDHCERLGVVREEHSLRQTLLKRKNLHLYGITTESDYLPHLQDIEKAMKTIQIGHDEHISIAQQLVDAGAVKTLRQANVTMAYCEMWQHGNDLRKILKQSQFYEHKARLKCIGIDISQQFDISRMCPTLKRSEVIEVQPLTVPNWYKMPVVNDHQVLPFKAA